VGYLAAFFGEWQYGYDTIAELVAKYRSPEVSFKFLMPLTIGNNNNY